MIPPEGRRMTRGCRCVYSPCDTSCWHCAYLPRKSFVRFASLPHLFQIRLEISSVFAYSQHCDTSYKLRYTNMTESKSYRCDSLNHCESSIELWFWPTLTGRAARLKSISRTCLWRWLNVYRMFKRRRRRCFRKPRVDAGTASRVLLANVKPSGKLYLWTALWVYVDVATASSRVNSHYYYLPKCDGEDRWRGTPRVGKAGANKIN